MGAFIYDPGSYDLWVPKLGDWIIMLTLELRADGGDEGSEAAAQALVHLGV